MRCDELAVYLADVTRSFLGGKGPGLFFSNVVMYL